MSYVKQNREFQVYSMLESRYRNGFWVGTGSSGLCYYSFDNGKLHELSNRETGTGGEVADVHSIFEESDSVLYLATSGKGFYKVIVANSKQDLQIKSWKNYRFTMSNKSLTSFIVWCHKEIPCCGWEAGKRD